MASKSRKSKWFGKPRARNSNILYDYQYNLIIKSLCKLLKKISPSSLCPSEALSLVELCNTALWYAGFECLKRSSLDSSTGIDTGSSESAGKTGSFSLLIKSSLYKFGASNVSLSKLFSSKPWGGTARILQSIIVSRSCYICVILRYPLGMCNLQFWIVIVKIL